MTANQILEMYRGISNDLQALEDELLCIDCQLQKCTSVWSDMPRGGSDDDRVATLLQKKFELDEYINDLAVLSARLRKQSDEILCQLSGKQQTVMCLRYISGLSWRQLAQVEGVDIETVRIHHRRAKNKTQYVV